MSYHGTVYCRHCYSKGHNKRTCPDYTETIKRRALEEINSGEGYDGYYGRIWLKRPPARKEGIYADGTPIPADKKKKTKQKRVCKYCGKQGHNRRTCPTLAADKLATIKETADLRERVIEGLKQAGLGIGAIVTQDEYGKKQGYMVIGFQSDVLTSESVRHNPRFLKTRVLRTEGVNTWNREPDLVLPPLEGVPELEDSWGRGNVSVAGPVSAAQVEAGVPEGWVEEHNFVDGIYADRQHRDYHENSYNAGRN